VVASVLTFHFVIRHECGMITAILTLRLIVGTITGIVDTLEEAQSSCIQSGVVTTILTLDLFVYKLRVIASILLLFQFC
jgi:hypothetical protein